MRSNIFQVTFFMALVSGNYNNPGPSTIPRITLVCVNKSPCCVVCVVVMMLVIVRLFDRRMEEESVCTQTKKNKAVNGNNPWSGSRSS